MSERDPEAYEIHRRADDSCRHIYDSMTSYHKRPLIYSKAKSLVASTIQRELSFKKPTVDN